MVVGDFNLDPDTISLKTIERSCPQNLIKQYEVKSTRSPLYEKPGKYADYVFLSEGLKAKTFEVLPDIASDHLALRVKIGIEP